MKAVIYTFILAVILVGCGGKTNAQKTEATDNTLDITDTVDAALSSEINPDDDPFSELILQYSPEEIREIIGKTDPQDVTDLLLLLPETDFLFYFNFDVEQRKRMLDGDTISYVELAEIDIANGYILSGYEGAWEMFAKKIHDVWWIALHENNCGEQCSTIQAKTYTFDSGKLIQRNYANLAGYQDVWLELFIDFDQLTEAQQKLANDIWEESDVSSNVLFKLPRDGKTITMYIEAYPYIEAGIPESAIKKVKKEIWK